MQIYNIATGLHDNCLTIRTLKNEIPNAILQSLLVQCIVDICEFYNVKDENTLNINQIQQLCELIINDDDFANYLTPELLKLFANRCKSGKYGKVYERIDGGTIMDFLNKFCDEVFEYQQNEIENEYQKHKSAFRSPNESGQTLIGRQLVENYGFNLKK